MKYNFRIFGKFFIGFSILFLTINFSQDRKVGDVNDGSKIHPVHLLNLLDSDGNIIDPNYEYAIPFSTKKTCGNECHNYEKISDGFHFNFHDTNNNKSENSEPWIYTDPTTLTILPLSYKKQNGTFSPDDVELSPIQFLFRFGPYYAGGDISEFDSLENPKDFLRWNVSGKLEVNCLICHDADPFYDQAEYASNIRKQNFKWAAVASTSFAEFKGNASKMPNNYDIYNLTTVQTIDQRSSVPPTLKYDKDKFNSANKVYFNVTKNIPNDNCYYCHSSIIADQNLHANWKNEEDVHLKAGLKCVDCHRNGVDHNMIKGTADDKLANSKTFTCEGCHIPNSENGTPTNGNLGAPIPQHLGIPAVHFERLTCTVCHSGKLPTDKPEMIKTSRAHFLGMHGTNKEPDVFPHIFTNVYTENNSDKIEPRNLIFPSFWGYKDSTENIIPFPIEFVEQNIRPMLGFDSLFNFGVWPNVKDSIVISILDSIKSMKIFNGQPALISGGKFFYVKEKSLASQDYNELGYSWKISHSVRPASQALGVNGCVDCHSVNSAFFTSDVFVESSLFKENNKTLSISRFQNNSEIYQSLFSLTFYFRPLLKYIIIFSAFVILIVFIGYSFSGFKSISKFFLSNNSEGV
ncbi:MAG: hypothetical protein IPM32_13340 [Ignavibacteriae bacterium]|nr:hypothetical protein [Ignavibacteriota bacterium]